jgi:GNAT superfamily N-acetyltransferase
MKEFHKIEVVDLSKSPWEWIRDEILELERAIFKEDAFEEEMLTEAFQDRDNIVLIMRDENGRAIGYTWATPAQKTYEVEADYDVFAGRTASVDTAYIYNTGLRPEYQGKGLVAELYSAQDKELLRRGYKRVHTDAKIEGGFAANLLKRNPGKVISNFEHDSPFGAQMFIDMWIDRPA